MHSVRFLPRSWAKGVTRKHWKRCIILHRFWAATQLLSWIFVSNVQEVIWTNCDDYLQCAILCLRWLYYRFHSLRTRLSYQHDCSKRYYQVLGTSENSWEEPFRNQPWESVCTEYPLVQLYTHTYITITTSTKGSNTCQTTIVIIKDASSPVINFILHIH